MLEDCVFEIINDFKSGSLFDSHTVINEMMKKQKFFEIYVKEFSNCESIAVYNSKIAQIIQTSGFVEAFQKDGEDLLIYTHNNLGNISPNHIWRKK